MENLTVPGKKDNKLTINIDKKAGKTRLSTAAPATPKPKISIGAIQDKKIFSPVANAEQQEEYVAFASTAEEMLANAKAEADSLMKTTQASADAPKKLITQEVKDRPDHDLGDTAPKSQEKTVEHAESKETIEAAAPADEKDNGDVGDLPASSVKVPEPSSPPKIKISDMESRGANAAGKKESRNKLAASIARTPAPAKLAAAFILIAMVAFLAISPLPKASSSDIMPASLISSNTDLLMMDDGEVNKFTLHKNISFYTETALSIKRAGEAEALEIRTSQSPDVLWDNMTAAEKEAAEKAKLKAEADALVEQLQAELEAQAARNNQLPYSEDDNNQVVEMQQKVDEAEAARQAAAFAQAQAAQKAAKDRADYEYSLSHPKNFAYRSMLAISSELIPVVVSRADCPDDKAGLWRGGHLDCRSSSNGVYIVGHNPGVFHNLIDQNYGLGDKFSLWDENGYARVYTIDDVFIIQAGSMYDSKMRARTVYSGGNSVTLQTCIDNAARYKVFVAH